jgi:hypothetical protein
VSYDPLANWHDQGACSFAQRGCMDSTAANFAPGATLPATCLSYAPAPSSGCLFPTALNYNSAAAAHDVASCMLSVVGCADSTADNYLPDVTVAGIGLGLG